MVILPCSSKASAARREQCPTSLRYLLIRVPWGAVSLMVAKGREWSLVLQWKVYLHPVNLSGAQSSPFHLDPISPFAGVKGLEQLKKEAKAFLDAMADDAVASAWVHDVTSRWRQIESEIQEKGTYTHTTKELQCDNESAKLAAERGFSTKLSHVRKVHGVHMSWIPVYLRAIGASVVRIASEINAADLLTKLLGKVALSRLCARLGLVSSASLVNQWAGGNQASSSSSSGGSDSSSPSKSSSSKPSSSS